MAFKILGPYKLALRILSDIPSAVHVRCIDKDKSMQMLQKPVGKIAGGLYVFAIRRQREWGKPWYVGISQGISPGAL